MNLQQTEVDNSNLEFKNTRLTADNLGGVNQRGAITGYVFKGTPTQPEAEETEEVAAEAPVEEAPVEEAAPEEEEVDDSPFASQFKSTFGIEPKEAIELVNNLQAFRDEQTLMRQWKVDPVTYDARMQQVRDFYSKLPEEGRDQFNTVEGANVIWEHLQKTGATEPLESKRTVQKSRVARQPQKPAYDYTRADILAMSDADYKRNLPKITEAFRNGRVKD